MAGMATATKNFFRRKGRAKSQENAFRVLKTVLELLKKLLYSAINPRKRYEANRVINGWPKICPQVYAWAKANPNSAQIVKEFWGPHKLRRQTPKSLDDSDVLPLVFTRNLEYPLYEKTLFRIKNTTIRGKEGILFLPDGSVTHQTAWAPEQITATDAYRKKWRGPEIFKKGNYSTLILYWGLGYYHWFNDVISTLHETLELMPLDTVFLMPQDFQNAYGGEFYLKTLLALGIARDRVVEFDGTESWTFENFWWQPPAVHPDDQTPSAMHWIGQQIVESVPLGQEESPVRIYISRTLPSARVVTNEADLLPSLQKMGFQVCRLESMVFEDQVRLFRNAEVVVGPHGAGFTNLIFSKPGTRVVEILAKGYERRCYWTLSSELGQNYQFYLGEPEFPGRRGEPDIKIDASLFLSVLKKRLNISQ
jgi:capsular polysaccharide biosynthesis protein